MTIRLLHGVTVSMNSCCTDKYFETMKNIECCGAMLLSKRHFVCPDCSRVYMIGVYSGLSRLDVEPEYFPGDRVLIVDRLGKPRRGMIKKAAYSGSQFSYIVGLSPKAPKTEFLESEIYSQATVHEGIKKSLTSFEASRKDSKLRVTASEIALRALKKEDAKLEKRIETLKATLKEKKKK